MFFIKNQPVGYAYVWKTGRVGPAAAVSHNVFIDTVRTAMGLAAEQESPNLGMLVTG